MPKSSLKKIGQLDCIVVDSINAKAPKAAVILCHGFGASGADLVSLADEFKAAHPTLADAMFVFPAAPLELDPHYDSRAWWMIDIERIQHLMATGQTREMRGTSPAELPACRQMIFEIIDRLRSDFDLASNQIVVGGFSQGAMLSTDVALHYPEPVGGLIIWSGALICESEWSQAAKQQSALRIVQTHGSLDPILPISGARELQTLLVACGHDVRYAEFSGPHTIPQAGLRNAVQLIREVVEFDSAKLELPK